METDLERLWSKIDRKGPTECWLWKSKSTKRYAYGGFHFNGKHYHGARATYLLVVGRIPTGLFVCHSCDRPLCCNPAHLWLGTQRDNMRDAAAKKRTYNPLGKTPTNAKLNPESVGIIRRLYQAGVTQLAIGEVYGVTNAAISLIITGKNWKHVA